MKSSEKQAMKTSDKKQAIRRGEVDGKISNRRYDKST